MYPSLFYFYRGVAQACIVRLPDIVRFHVPGGICKVNGCRLREAALKSAHFKRGGAIPGWDCIIDMLACPGVYREGFYFTGLEAFCQAQDKRAVKGGLVCSHAPVYAVKECNGRCSGRFRVPLIHGFQGVGLIGLNPCALNGLGLEACVNPLSVKRQLLRGLVVIPVTVSTVLPISTVFTLLVKLVIWMAV